MKTHEMKLKWKKIHQANRPTHTHTRTLSNGKIVTFFFFFVFFLFFYFCCLIKVESERASIYYTETLTCHVLVRTTNRVNAHRIQSECDDILLFLKCSVCIIFLSRRNGVCVTHFHQFENRKYRRRRWWWRWRLWWCGDDDNRTVRHNNRRQRPQL